MLYDFEDLFSWGVVLAHFVTTCSHLLDETARKINSHTKIGEFYSDILSNFDFALLHYRKSLALSSNGRDTTKSDDNLSLLYVEAARNTSHILTLLGRQLEALQVLEGARLIGSAEDGVVDAMISILLSISDDVS